jgi:hypothetical protein
MQISGRIQKRDCMSFVQIMVLEIGIKYGVKLINGEIVMN